MIEVGGVSLLVAFAAGLLSCISPCVLPLAPIYMGNLIGSSAVTTESVGRNAAVGHAVAFMLGFLLLFVVLGLSVGLIGYVLRDQLTLIQKAGGIFLIVMGLHMTKIVQLSLLYRGLGIDWNPRPESAYLRSFLAGTSISAGWLPCIGPTLGSILTLAVASGTAWQGGVLLLAYSLGLAVPFVVVGVILARVPRVLRWLNRHEHAVSFGSGVVMILMGIVLFTGTLQQLNAYFNFSGSGLGARI